MPGFGYGSGRFGDWQYGRTAERTEAGLEISADYSIRGSVLRVTPAPFQAHEPRMVTTAAANLTFNGYTPDHQYRSRMRAALGQYTEVHAGAILWPMTVSAEPVRVRFTGYEQGADFSALMSYIRFTPSKALYQGWSMRMTGFIRLLWEPNVPYSPAWGLTSGSRQHWAPQTVSESNWE